MPHETCQVEAFEAQIPKNMKYAKTKFLGLLHASSDVDSSRRLIRNSAAFNVIAGRDMHRGGLNHVECTKDGQQIFTASLDGSCKVVSTKTGKVGRCAKRSFVSILIFNAPLSFSSEQVQP